MSQPPGTTPKDVSSTEKTDSPRDDSNADRSEGAGSEADQSEADQSEADQSEADQSEAVHSDAPAHKPAQAIVQPSEGKESAAGQPEHQHVEVSQRLVFVNAVSSVLARVVNFAGLFFALRYLLTRIPPEEFAVYPVVTAVMVFAPLFFSFFTGGVARYMVEAYAQGNFRRVTEIVSSMVPLIGALALGFLAVGMLFSYFIDTFLNIAPHMVPSAQLMMGLLVVSFSLQMFLLPFGAGYFVKQRFVERNLIAALRDIVRVVLLFVLLIGVGPDVVWWVVANVAAELLHLTAITWRSCRMLPEIRLERALVRWGTAKELVSFGLWTTLGRLATVMYSHAATLILNGYGTALDVTNYHLGATCFQQIRSMIDLARQPLQPALIAMHSLSDEARLARTALRGGRYGLWVSMTMATPLTIFADEFVELWIGAQYGDASLVLILFMLTFPFSQAAGLLPMIAMARAQVRVFNTAAFVSTFVCLALMLLLAAVFDLGAIAIALALAFVTIFAQILYFWRLNFRLAGIDLASFARRVLRPGLAPGLVAGATWFALKWAIAPDNWIELAGAVLAGALVYVAVLAGFCLDEADRKIVQKVRAKLGG